MQARVFQGFSNSLIVRHAQLGGELLPWAVGLFVMSVVAWGLPILAARSTADSRLNSAGVTVAVAVLAVVFAAICVVQVYRIGDAGSKAAWSTNFCAQPYVGDTCPTA